jgi:DNA-binding CsgD family transcriptional regulator
MPINEMALQKFLQEVKKRLERHGTLLRQHWERDEKILAVLRRHKTLLAQHRERDKKILAVIRRVLEINSGTIEAMPTDKELSAHQAARKKLSKAERSVYDLMFTHRNKEIANTLNLSVNTVKNHIKAIRRKLGITRNRKEKYLKDAV